MHVNFLMVLSCRVQVWLAYHSGGHSCAHPAVRSSMWKLSWWLPRCWWTQQARYWPALSCHLVSSWTNLSKLICEILERKKKIKPSCWVGVCVYICMCLCSGLVSTVSLWSSLFMLLQDEDQEVRSSASDFIANAPIHLIRAGSVHTLNVELKEPLGTHFVCTCQTLFHVDL